METLSKVDELEMEDEISFIWAFIENDATFLIEVKWCNIPNIHLSNDDGVLMASLQLSGCWTFIEAELCSRLAI